jgi:RNA-directed DNA polymerase
LPEHFYGYRKGRSPLQAIAFLSKSIGLSDPSKFHLVKINIEKCFDNISHDFIIREIKPISCGVNQILIRKWLKTGIVERGITFYPKKGVPQGGVISSLLCNLALNGIDEIIRPNLPRIATKDYRNLSGC